MPRPAEVGKHYRGRLGEAYFDYQSPVGRLGARLDVRKFLPHMREADVVVDFGCGDGSILNALPGNQKIGVEANASARQAATERGLRVVKYTSAVHDGIADVVISNHALEHTINPAEQLADLYRILRPGGKLVLWLPVDDWRTQRRSRANPDHHLYTWTPLLLGNLLDEVGFRIESVRVVTHAWPPFAEHAARLPPRIFDAAAFAWSIMTKRRQLEAIALR